MRRSLPLLAVVVLPLFGCSAPTPTGAVKAESRNCADVFASAMASRGEVKGSWDCLTPTIQAQFRAVGLDGDAGVAQLASKDPVHSHQRYMGRLSDGGYVYALSGGSAASVLLLWLDSSGRITDIQSGGRGQTR